MPRIFNIGRSPEADPADELDNFVISDVRVRILETLNHNTDGATEVITKQEYETGEPFTADAKARQDRKLIRNGPFVLGGTRLESQPEAGAQESSPIVDGTPSSRLEDAQQSGSGSDEYSQPEDSPVLNGNGLINHDLHQTPVVVEPEPVLEPTPAAVKTQTFVVPRPPKARRSRHKLPSLELGKKAETYSQKFRGYGKRILAAVEVLDPRPLLEKAKNSSTPNLLKRLGSIAARDLNEAMLASSNMGMGLLNPNYLTKTKPTTSERLQKLSIAPGAAVEPEPVVEPSAEDEPALPETAPAQKERISRRLRIRKGLATLAIIGAVITPKINARQRLSSAWTDIKNFSRFTDSNAADQTVSVAVEPEPVADPQLAAVKTQTYVVPRPPKARRSTPKMPSFELGKKAETYSRKFRGFVGKTALAAARVLDPRPQLEKTKTPAMQDRYKKLGSAISALAADFRPALYPHEKQALSTGWKKASSALAADFRPALYPHEKQALLNAWDKTRKAYHLGIARVSNGLSSGFENLYKD